MNRTVAAATTTTPAAAAATAATAASTATATATATARRRRRPRLPTTTMTTTTTRSFVVKHWLPQQKNTISNNQLLKDPWAAHQTIRAGYSDMGMIPHFRNEEGTFLDNIGASKLTAWLYRLHGKHREMMWPIEASRKCPKTLGKASPLLRCERSNELAS